MLDRIQKRFVVGLDLDVIPVVLFVHDVRIGQTAAAGECAVAHDGYGSGQHDRRHARHVLEAVCRNLGSAGHGDDLQGFRNDIAVCVVECFRCIVLIAVEEPCINKIVFSSICCFTGKRNGQALQLGATPERIASDCFHAVADDSALQIGAAVEDALAKCFDSIRNTDLCKSAAAVECVTADCPE